MSKHARNPKHRAEQSAASRIREHQAWRLFVIAPFIPAEGFGKHRKES